MLFIHAQLLNLDKTIQSSMLNCLSVCVPWNNAGDCIHPSRGQSSHYCAALFKYDVLYHNIAYCVTILVCMVLAGREYNIHMSAPQWGGWYFTFYPPLLHSAAPTILNVSCHHPHFS